MDYYHTPILGTSAATHFACAESVSILCERALLLLPQFKVIAESPLMRYQFTSRNARCDVSRRRISEKGVSVICERVVVVVRALGLALN